MAKDHRRVDVQMAQKVLLDDPAFLREICEWVAQSASEAYPYPFVDASYEKVRVDGRVVS